MTNKQRLALFLICMGILVFIGLIFSPFVVANLLTPLALIGWFFMRIYILSVDQHVYWWIFIALALYWIARRFMGSSAEGPALAETTPNDTLQAIDKWRSSIFVSLSYRDLRQQLKLELIQMLISLFSSRQQEVTYAAVFEPLKERQITLPDPVYEFLFTPEPDETRLTFMQKLRALPQAPRRWWRSWSGQEAAEFHQSIEAVLTFIESTLEIPHDDESSDRSNH